MNTIKTDELCKAVTTSLDEAVERYQGELHSMKSRIQDLETNTLAVSTNGQMQTAKSNIARLVTKSDGFSAAKAGRHSGVIELGSLSIKALTSEQFSPDSPQSGISVLPQEAGMLAGWAARPVSLLDVMRRIQVSSNTLQWTKLAAFSNAAASQAGEGVAKAEQNLSPELVRAEVSTIAVFHRASRQVLDDAAWLGSELERLLRFNLMDELERQLIAGDGSSFTINGLDNQATAVTGSSGLEAPDQIGAALATMASDGYPAAFVIANPSDFQSWRSERATGGEYVSGSWSQPNPPVLWGVPVVQSASQQSGEVIMVNGQSAAIMDRMSPTLEMFPADQDNVVKNLITFRAELRAGCAVFDAAGVRKLAIV